MFFINSTLGIHGFKYFNRGMLLNAGFMESQKQAGGWQCFIFHDIDLLPLDLRNIYSCPHPKHSRHHAAFIQNYNIRNGTNYLMPLCKSPRFGPFLVDLTGYELELLEIKYPEVQSGQYSPPMCNVPHKVAIIVPYRNNQQQLKIFLNHMHGFLRKQKIGYGIFLVQQKGIHAFKYFNRGMLLNAGFMESQKQAGGWQCFIFHDIDLLPLDLRNIYSCPHPKHPRHHAAFIQNYNISIPNVFGGVLAFTEEQFINVNGFSNRFWGTGGEDDDMFHRLSQGNYSTARYNQSISQYASFGHEQESPDLKRNALNEAKATFKEDGLNNLTYRASKIRYPLYTFIMVDLDLPNYLIETDITH